MNDDRGGCSLDHPDLVKDGGCAAADEHRQAVVELEDANWVGVGVQDVLVAHSMLAGTGRDYRLGTHGSKLACDPIRLQAADNEHVHGGHCRSSSNLGGSPSQVACPWCEGTGTQIPGHDAEAARSAAA